MPISKIKGSGIEDDAITSARLDDGTIVAVDLASEAVNTSKMSGLTSSSSGIIQADGDGTMSVTTADLVDDTTPQLGGDLDGNGNTIDLSGSTEAFTLPKGTTAERPSSPVEGMIRYNTTEDETEEYNDGSWIPLTKKFVATGGTETTSGGYKYHTFTSSGTFTVQSGDKQVEYLVVAGGAGGAQGGITYSEGAGGGGAGGAIDSSFYAGVGDYTVTIGAGGSGQSGSYGSGTGGSDSVFGSTTATGGGGGGAGGGGGNGGSGGGGGADGANRPGGSGTSGQGNDGGDGDWTPTKAGGGGGGKGSAGADATNSAAGDGGTGIDWKSLGTYYAAGGGGGRRSSSGNGTGGSSIGGDGAYSASAGDGAVNTGSGGGGCTSTSTSHRGGNGSSGIVIIRYAV